MHLLLGRANRRSNWRNISEDYHKGTLSGIQIGFERMYWRILTVPGDTHTAFGCLERICGSLLE